MPGPNNASNRFGPSSYVVGTTLGDGCNFTTVASAIAQAVADGFNTANPTTILVRAGIYPGTFTMAPGIYVVGVSNGSQNIPNVTISGSIIIDAATAGGVTYGLENLFISDGGTTVTTINAGLIILDIGNCSIVGDTPLTVANISGTFSQISLRDCTLNGNTNGLVISEHNLVSMSNCSVDGGTTSVIMNDTARSIVTASRFSSTTTYGFQFTGSNRLDIRNSSIVSIQEAFIGLNIGEIVFAAHCTINSDAISTAYIDNVGLFEMYDIALTGSALLNNSIATNFIDWQPHAATAANAVLPGAVRGTSSFDSAAFTVTDGWVTPIGGPSAGSFPVDNGGPGVPLLGAMSFLGSTSVDFPIPSGIETHVGATTNEIYLEDRRWTSSLIVDPDATVGLRGTFTTITAALAAAVPLQTIYVRPGIYTESFVLKDFVNIVGLTTPSGGINGIASVGNLIDGTITTDAGSGSSTLQNLRINASVGSSIVVTDGAIVNIVGCTVQSTTICLQMIDGTAFIDGCYVSGGVNAVEYDTNSGPTVRASNSRLDSGSSAVKIDTSSTFFAKNCQFVNGGGNCLEATVLGINVEFTNCQLISNGTNAIDVSGGGSLSVNFCEVNAPGASAIELGAGGCAVRSFHNTYNSGGPNYITGTVGSYDFANDVINPITSANIDPGITVTTYGWRPWATVAGAPGTNSDKGNASFDSAQFTSTDGFIQISGGNSPPFTDVSGVVSAIRNNGYYATAATTFTLDSLALQGDLVIIYADTAAAVVVTANAGQQIRLANTITAVAGTATNALQGDSLTLRFRAATSVWETVASVGNWVLV